MQYDFVRDPPYLASQFSLRLLDQYAKLAYRYNRLDIGQLCILVKQFQRMERKLKDSLYGVVRLPQGDLWLGYCNKGGRNAEKVLL